MKAESARTSGSLLRHLINANKSVFKTWWFCKKNKLDHRSYYAVYEDGTNNILAMCGPLPGAKDRADLIARAINLNNSR